MRPPQRADRRGVLASAAAGGGRLFGLPLGRGGPLRVDAHAHALPPAYERAVAAARYRGPLGPLPSWSERSALSFMRRYGIDAQVLSISDPGVEFVGVDESVALARAVNDELASLVRRRPERFAALAVLPMRDVAASVAELSRALDELALDGVGLLSNYGGEYLGAPRFAPVLAELDRRGTYAFLHPTVPAAGDKPPTGLPDPLVEFTFETTRAVDSLLRGGAAQRYPNIRWQLAHAGGMVPTLTNQLASDLGFAPDPALEAMRYDTALSSSPWAMAGVRGAVGVDRVVFGTDWPFSQLTFLFGGTPQPELRRSFTNDELRVVLAGNVLNDLPRLADAIGRRDG